MEDSKGDDIIGTIRQLEAVGLRFRRPASDEDLRAMAADLGCVLPPDVLAPYRHGDGMERRSDADYGALTAAGGSVGDLFRLMSTAEVRETHPVAVYDGGLFGHRYFCTDDQSDYAGLYVEGRSRAAPTVFADGKEERRAFLDAFRQDSSARSEASKRRVPNAAAERWYTAGR